MAYSNPNIHPAEEYTRRLETLRDWANAEGIEVIEGLYDPDTWEEQVGCYGTDREQRCRACYRLRFARVAAYAAEHGYEGISSTLTVSPYQFTEVIGEELHRAAAQVGVQDVFRDFRENYPQATTRSREIGMYRQNYCGCHFSYLEAEKERAERKAARKAAKEAKREAREKALQEQAALKTAASRESFGEMGRV